MFGKISKMQLKEKFSQDNNAVEMM